MGKRGPAPKPPGTHAPGTHRDTKAKSGPAPLPPVSGELDPPSILGDVGRDRWGWLISKLRAMRLLSSSDYPAMTRYCRDWERWWDAQEHIEAEGESTTKETRRGPVVVQTFYSKLAGELSRELRALEGQFGLTPSARSGLGGAKSPVPTEAEDKAQRFIKRGTG